MTRSCPDCGREEPPNVRFCVFCGAALQPAAAASAATPTVDREEPNALQAACLCAAAVLIAAMVLTFIIAAGVSGIHRSAAANSRARPIDLLSLPDTSFVATGLVTGLNPLLPLPPPPSLITPVASPTPVSTPDPEATETPEPTATATPPASSSLLNQFVRIRDIAGSECVNVRRAASLNAGVLRCLDSGSLAQVVEGPQQADGHDWWKLDAGGWAAGDFLIAAGGTPGSAPAAVPDPGAGLAQSIDAGLARAVAVASAQTVVSGYTGWATYYGIEDGFVRGDIMNDGAIYDPADPTITAASFHIPMHTWLRVCTTVRCILVQVRDRGLLDENGIMLDLSRAAYALLFGGLNGKQWVAAYFVGSAGPAAPAAAIATAAPAALP